MFGFTLSKLNMLIFVTAVFVIVVFFMGKMDDSIKAKQLSDLISSQGIISAEMLSSPNFCDSINRYFPTTISTYAEQLYYVVKISTLETTDDQGNKKTLVIFSAADRLNKTHSLTSTSFYTDSEVHIYSNNQDQCPGTAWCEPAPQELTLDPNARTPTNSMWIVKEVENGKKKLYIFPCTFTSAIYSSCDTAKQQVGEVVRKAENQTGGFRC